MRTSSTCAACAAATRRRRPWLPCTGPTLGAILTAASTQDTVGKGGDDPEQKLLDDFAAAMCVVAVLGSS